MILRLAHKIWQLLKLVTDAKDLLSFGVVNMVVVVLFVEPCINLELQTVLWKLIGEQEK